MEEIKRVFYQDIYNKIDEEDYMLNSDNSYFSGILFDNYPNGQLKYEKTIIEGTLDGIYNEYYENGQLKCFGIMKKSKKVGEWASFFESGNLRKETFYNLGIIALYKIYNKNGQCIEEYKTNMSALGMSTKEEINRWYPNGKIKENISVLYGIVQERKLWNEDGLIIEQYTFKEYDFDTLYL